MSIVLTLSSLTGTIILKRKLNDNVTTALTDLGTALEIRIVVKAQMFCS